LRTDPEKVKAILEIPPLTIQPRSQAALRRFLGMVSWYRRFIPNVATTTGLLNELLKKKSQWEWEPTQKAAFTEVKGLLVTAPVLRCSDFTVPFILQTDASDVGRSTQEISGTERVVAYASRALRPAEKNYSTTEKECLAVVWGIEKMRPYLEGYRFKVVTDHFLLRWLRSLENPIGRLARWAVSLQQHDFEVEYRRGTLNYIPDALSRQSLKEGEDANSADRQELAAVTPAKRDSYSA